MDQLQLFSSRSDNGGARPSVQALIMNIKVHMRARDMQSLGWDPAIVMTLLNHINQLEGRIDELN